MPDTFAKDFFESILEAILLIEERFAKIKEVEDFVSSTDGTILLDSISMRLQIIGELVKKIEKTDKTILENYPDIEWAMIMRLRDIISHHYDVIDHEIIYDICKNHLPTLKTAVTEFLQNAR